MSPKVHGLCTVCVVPSCPANSTTGAVITGWTILLFSVLFGLSVNFSLLSCLSILYTVPVLVWHGEMKDAEAQHSSYLSGSSGYIHETLGASEALPLIWGWFVSGTVGSFSDESLHELSWQSGFHIQVSLYFNTLRNRWSPAYHLSLLCALLCQSTNAFQFAKNFTTFLTFILS